MSTPRHDTEPRPLAGLSATAPPPVERSRAGLLTLLDAVDVEGWNGPAATALLTYVRTDLIRPLAIDVGLRGAVASQAEATAWEAVWLQLCAPSTRSAKSPWGVLWQTARRALLGEILSARWGTNGRRAWEHDAAERDGTTRRPLSLDALVAAGTPPSDAASTSPVTSATPVSQALQAAAHALATVGWDTDTARRIVCEIASMDEPLGHGATVIGWRPLATRLGMPPWQARRLTAVLRGTIEQPGLLARLVCEGDRVLGESDVHASLAGTRSRTGSSPTTRRVA